MNELDSKVNKCNIVPCNTVEETLKKLHSFTEEHVEKQPLFREIEDDFKHFEKNVTVQQSIMQFKVRFSFYYVFPISCTINITTYICIFGYIFM